ncbi:hypothetical protein M0805_009343 [Coniferiporia weirii]|nr:hypothetical protein M0805_009343 [Coniferiporia weirii]
MSSANAATSPSSKGKRTSAKKAPTKASTSKATPKKAAVPVKAGLHPAWKDIIKECIADNTSDARSGVSRSTIKKFAETKYKIEMTGLNLSMLNRAIAHGADAGTFILPKGPSGKVKLAPKNKPSASSKENTKPVSPKAKVATGKPVAKPAVVKKAAATKPVAKKAAPAKKTVAKASTDKKPKAVAAAKKTSSKKTDTKKAAAKAAAGKPKASKPAVKPKPTSKSKPSSRRAKA